VNSSIGEGNGVTGVLTKANSLLDLESKYDANIISTECDLYVRNKLIVK
jgi:hypothetical protein